MPAEWQPARGQRAPGLSWGPAESQTLAPRKRVLPWARPEHAASASRSQESGHVDVPARVTSLAPPDLRSPRPDPSCSGGDLPDSWWRRCRAQVAVRGRHPVLAGAASGYGFSPLASSLSPAWPAGGCCLPFVGASPLPGDRGRPAPRPPPLQEPQIQLRSQVLFLAVLGPWPLEARRALVASRGGQSWAVPVLRTSPPGPMCIPPALAASSENSPTARRSPQVRREGRASEPHAQTWGGAPQVWRWQVQRPWGRDRPDLLQKGGGGVRGG